MGKLIISVCIISLLFIMCEKQTDKDDSIDVSLLNGNSYILKVDRVLKNRTDVQFPGDNLQESDYVLTSEEIEYDVTISENGKIVTIEPETVRGEMLNDCEESILYNFVEGVFAGGRFVIRKNREGFEGEYTIYGSGVPIVSSGRGKLVPVIK